MTVVKDEELPDLGCFKQTWYHVVFIPVHDMRLCAIVLAGNNRIALLKVRSTRILRNLKLVLAKECVKEF